MKIKVESTIITEENIKRTIKVLIDNGIEKSEVGVVLQAIGYTLIDTELECEEYENLVYKN